jgi:RNA polymerase sigma-70 factor (ECF subfamily)
VPGDPWAERLAADEVGPDEWVVRADLAARCEAAVAQLPEDSRMVVVLRDVEGLSTKDVAQLLGISENVVKVRLSRAHARLRAMVSDEPGPQTKAAR